MNLQEYLDTLPKTKDEIASLLKERGIKGQKSKCYYCPVANLLKQEGFNASVTPAYVRDWRKVGNGVSELPISEGVREFVIAFDNSEYPELEEPAS